MNRLPGQRVEQIAFGSVRQQRPRCIEQVRRWVRAGKIYPPPTLDGREYLVDENAVKISTASPSSSQSHSNGLLQKVKNGRKETKPRYARSSP